MSIDSAQSGYLANALLLTDSVVTDIGEVVQSSCFGLEVFLDNTNAVGRLDLEVCNDPNRTSPAATWVKFPRYRMAVKSGTDIESFWNCERIAAGYIRVRYTRTSGSGLLYVSFRGKK